MSSVAAIVVCGAACAAMRVEPEQHRTQSSESPWEEGCGALEVPATLPPVDVLVDSAALEADLVRYVSSLQGRLEGWVLLSVAHDSLGVNTRRDVIAHTTTTAVADSVQKLVFSAARKVEEGAGPWNVRLRVEFRYDVPTLHVARSEACRPRPRDPALEAQWRSAPAAGVRYRRGARERVIIVEVEITPAGVVRKADVKRGPPMTTDLQRQIGDYTRRLFFHPATLDGRPVTGWLQIPLTVRD